MKNSKGFTLIELLIVMTIIVILVTLVAGVVGRKSGHGPSKGEHRSERVIDD